MSVHVNTIVSITKLCKYTFVYSAWITFYYMTDQEVHVISLEYEQKHTLDWKTNACTTCYQMSLLTYVVSRKRVFTFRPFKTSNCFMEGVALKSPGNGKIWYEKKKKSNCIAR